MIGMDADHARFVKFNERIHNLMTVKFGGPFGQAVPLSSQTSAARDSRPQDVKAGDIPDGRQRLPRR